MAVKSNQLEVPFTSADKAKLDGISPGAEPQPATATQAEAEAGLDNIKMMTPLRVSEAISAQISGGSGTALTENFLNSSGTSINAFTLVKQDTLSTIAKVDPSVEADVNNILGVLLQSTANGASGLVCLSGLVKNISTGFAVGDVLYLAKSGSLTTTIPDIGAAGYVVGDFVVKVGRIVKNLDNPTNKDFKQEIEIRGQL